MSSHNTYSVEAILFDMDGTIVDSSIPVHKAWKTWASSLGIPFERVVEIMHGRRAIETMRILAPGLKQPQAAEEFLAMEALDLEGIVEIPGAAAFLGSLPADRWAVVTSATQTMARDRIAAAGLPMPKVLVSADMVSQGKPHPEPFLKAAEMLGVDPLKCLAFEDAPAGIESAKAAGMTVIGVETHYQGADLNVIDAIRNYRDSGIMTRIKLRL